MAGNHIRGYGSVSVLAFIKVVLVFLQRNKYNGNCQMPCGICILAQTIRSGAFWERSDHICMNMTAGYV